MYVSLHLPYYSSGPRMPRRRLQDRIEDLVTKAIATKDPDELDEVIQFLRDALHEHSERLRKLAAAKLCSHPKARESLRDADVI